MGIVALVSAVAAAYDPAWWGSRGVVDPVRPANDFAPANQGQAKWMAMQARDEFETMLIGLGGAGPEIDALVTGLPDTANFAPINIGQAKNLAKPFYDRLASLAAGGHSEVLGALPAGVTGTYPWTETTDDDNDFAPINVGQLKRLFAFDFDFDMDRIPDWWVQLYFDGLEFDPDGDDDGDGLINKEEDRLGTNPLTPDTVRTLGMSDVQTETRSIGSHRAKYGFAPFQEEGETPEFYLEARIDEAGWLYTSATPWEEFVNWSCGWFYWHEVAVNPTTGVATAIGAWDGNAEYDDLGYGSHFWLALTDVWTNSQVLAPGIQQPDTCIPGSGHTGSYYEFDSQGWWQSREWVDSADTPYPLIDCSLTPVGYVYEEATLRCTNGYVDPFLDSQYERTDTRDAIFDDSMLDDLGRADLKRTAWDDVPWDTAVLWNLNEETTDESSNVAARDLSDDETILDLTAVQYRFSWDSVPGTVYHLAWIETFQPENGDPVYTPCTTNIKATAESSECVITFEPPDPDGTKSLSLLKVDLAATDLDGAVADATEGTTGAYVHWNLDNDDASDNTLGANQHPGADYLQTATSQVAGEDDLKSLSMSLYPDLSQGFVVLTVDNAKAKVWKDDEKGSTNLVLAGAGSKTWDLSDSAQKADFLNLSASLWVEGVDSGVANLKLAYKDSGGTEISSDRVKYTFIAADCGRQPRTDSPSERAAFSAGFPNLVHCEWAILADNDPTFNCFASSVGINNQVIELSDIDAAGESDGIVTQADLDAFYSAHGLVPCAANEATVFVTTSSSDATMANPLGLSHAASLMQCDFNDGKWRMFKSKMGTGYTISHREDQLDGGAYGSRFRYYKPQ